MRRLATLRIKNQITRCQHSPHGAPRCDRPAVRFYFSRFRKDFDHVLFCENHAGMFRGAKCRYFVIGEIRE